MALPASARTDSLGGGLVVGDMWQPQSLPDLLCAQKVESGDVRPGRPAGSALHRHVAPSLRRRLHSMTTRKSTSRLPRPAIHACGGSFPFSPPTRDAGRVWQE
jgi:hypothetical protein